MIRKMVSLLDHSWWLMPVAYAENFRRGGKFRHNRVTS